MRGEDLAKKLTERMDLLVERNKHILLAEEYGWDTSVAIPPIRLLVTRMTKKRYGGPFRNKANS